MLFRGYVMWREIGISDLCSRYLRMIVDIFRRVHGRFSVHAILVARCRFRRVEAGLNIRGISRGATNEVTSG